MKLRDYLLKIGIKQSDFAEEVQCSRSYLSLIICGKLRPSKKFAKVIEKETKGTIKAQDILSGEALGYQGKAIPVTDKFIRDKQPKENKKLFSLI